MPLARKCLFIAILPFSLVGVTGSSFGTSQPAGQSLSAAQNLPHPPVVARNSIEKKPSSSTLPKRKRLKEGDDMPSFTLESVEGGLIPFSRYSGKVVIACLGSIYCEPCRELIPVLRKLQQQYEKRGLEVIGIDVDEATKTEEIKTFIAKRNVTYEVLRGTRDFGNRLGVFVVPTTFMVDRKGVIRKKYMGFKEREVLEKDLMKLLEELPPKEEESDGK